MPRYNKESFLDLLNEDEPKLETISFETISKVVKNCTDIKNKDKLKDHETVSKEFEKSLKDHETIMKHVDEVFKDKSKDDFGNLIIDKEISEYIKAIYLRFTK